MRSSAVAGMVFLLSQELCQMVKPMTEIELNEKIENLLTESAPRQPSRRTGSAYRREMRIRKNDALMRIVTRRYVPHAGYIQKVQGYGSANPVADNSTSAGQAQNRRGIVLITAL